MKKIRFRCIQSLKMAPFPESSWEGYIQHVKFWRNEVKRSMGESISNIEIVRRPDGRIAILGLATAPGDSASNQMVMHAEIPVDSPLPTANIENDDLPILELKPLIDPNLVAGLTLDKSTEGNPTKLSAELALHYERMRGQIVGGVTGYCVHAKSGAVLISTPTQLTVFRGDKLDCIAEWVQSSVLNASFCEANPEFVAFTSQGQLFIDRNNSPIFASDSSRPNITNGVASFVAQEEFERYDGHFWSPTRVELLYERVDETPVVQLPFTLPGVRPDSEDEPMRYPLAGTKNAISTIRICRLDEGSNAKFVDLELDADIRTVVPWMEYIVRMGWTADGNEVHILVMNRVQTQLAVLLIPRTLFVGPNDGKGVGQIRQVYQESCPFWINANNHLRFLPPVASQQSDGANFIVGSERNDLCHLYLHNTLSSDSKAITAGTNWAVLKEVVLKVDSEKGLVFYLANRISPLLLNLCVSSFISPYSNAEQCRVLTPTDLCYKFERSCPSLYLNPDIGFVCWLSSVTQLPECRFYRLIYSNADPFPRAVFTHRIGVQMLPASPGGLNTSTWGLPYLHRPSSEIFSHRFFEFVSRNSGKTHYALLLWPAQIGKAKDGDPSKFPVIQAVYAGPSIQLVRNSWHSVSQFLKFVSYGYAVVLVDGRGSANRGVQFESAIKKRFGSVEIEDQMEGLREVAAQSDLLDLERVAVIGWSYGGFASLLLLAEYPKLYRCACAGGAVSDWHLYDTAYTERYMELPQDNEDAYNKSALDSRIARLPNQEGRLLIIHGMIDENVHFAHCSKLISALISAQKPHQLLLFPGERHAIRNGDAIEFYHANILSFFGKALAVQRKN